MHFKLQEERTTLGHSALGITVRMVCLNSDAMAEWQALPVRRHDERTTGSI